jgi:hypothetical protein
LLVSSAAFAGSVCSTATLAAYAAGSGCNIDDLSFSNFSLGNFNGGNLSASSVQVVPTTSEPGFTFLMQGPTAGSSINFAVLPTTRYVIVGLTEDISASFSPGAVENVCFGAGNGFNGFNAHGVPKCANEATATQVVTGYGEPSSASLSFPPASGLTVSTGFILNCSSSVSLTEQFSASPSPEPGTWMFLSTGLVGLGWLVRDARAKRRGQKHNRNLN